MSAERDREPLGSYAMEKADGERTAASLAVASVRSKFNKHKSGRNG